MKHILDTLREIQNSNMSQQVKSNLMEHRYTLSLGQIQELLNLARGEVGQQPLQRQGYFQQPQQQGCYQQPPQQSYQQQWQQPGQSGEHFKSLILKVLEENKNRGKHWEALYNSVQSNQEVLFLLIMKAEQLFKALSIPPHQAVQDTLNYQAASVGLILNVFDPNNATVQEEIKRLKSLGDRLDSMTLTTPLWSSLVVNEEELWSRGGVTSLDELYRKEGKATVFVDKWVDFTTSAMRRKLIDFVTSLDEVTVERFMRVTIDEALTFDGVGPSTWLVIEGAQRKMMKESS